MQIFEYPYIIITIFAFCFILLLSVGATFALRGIKVANGKDEKDFVNLNKLESSFEKSGKLREDRSVFYICISAENFQNLYSGNKTEELISGMKKCLLDTFSDEGNCVIASYGEKNFVAFAKWDMETARQNIEAFLADVNKCLSEYSAINIVDVTVGSFFAFGTQVSFDEAINRAKQGYMLAQNENVPYAEWNVSSGKALEQKIKIENNIEKEIDNNHFFLEYQPVLDAKTKKIIGAEVLARLNSESDGVLTPGSFLSAVDSVGISDKFDYYIFEKNCKWISNDKKQREGYKYTINFSRSTLCEVDFSEKIIAVAQKYDLSFSCLAIEILEDKNIVGDEKEQMINNLKKLKEMGMSIFLDDFGSGYTTFGDLQNFDISVVKIDRSITKNAVSETGFIILKNIISTAQGIGFKTLCEGVETEEQEEAVIKAGCDFLQGFYYYKPMPVTQLEKLFEQNTGGV